MKNMNVMVVQLKGKTYLECLPGETIINKEQDILDLLASGYEYDTNLFMFYESNFSPDLFDLKTGLAGVIFQKLATYYVKAAFILNPDKTKSKRFMEFISECNKGNQVHFFQDKNIAEEWLVG